MAWELALMDSMTDIVIRVAALVALVLILLAAITAVLEALGRIT